MIENLVMWQWKRFYRPYVETQGLIDDIKAEKNAIACELEVIGLPNNKDKKVLNKAINRKWHKFLKAYGFRKSKHQKRYAPVALSGILHEDYE